MRKIGKKRGKEQSAAGQLQFPFSRAGTCGTVGVCRRGTEGVQDELNRDVKLRKR
jgi:hypothetical protein